jgi:hypothetical protein
MPLAAGMAGTGMEGTLILGPWTAVAAPGVAMPPELRGRFSVYLDLAVVPEAPTVAVAVE